MRSTDSSSAINISPKQWFDLLVVYLLVPVILFWSAGTFSWWQGWLYSFLILGAGIGGRLWAESWHPGITADRQNRQIIDEGKAWDKLLAPLMALSISYPMVLVAGLDYRYNWSMELSLWLCVVGFIFVAFGYALSAWALAENRFFYSVVSIQTERGHTVCDSGPYRFVRHPGYSGFLFSVFGIVLALGSLWALVPALFALIIGLLRTALEDKTLHEELPGYTQYAQRVRYRLLPRIY